MLFMWIPSNIRFMLSCINSKCACYDFNTKISFKVSYYYVIFFFLTRPKERGFDDVLTSHFPRYSINSELAVGTLVCDVISQYLKTGILWIFISLMNSNICGVSFSPILEMSAEYS